MLGFTWVYLIHAKCLPCHVDALCVAPGVIPACIKGEWLVSCTPRLRVTGTAAFRVHFLDVKGFMLWARRYGDSVRSGWRNVIDCVVRLHRLGLLPSDVVRLPTIHPSGITGTHNAAVACPLCAWHAA